MSKRNRTAPPVERGRGPLDAEEAARLRAWLEIDEPDALASTGLSRGAIYRAAAALQLNAGTRLACRSALTARGTTR